MTRPTDRGTHTPGTSATPGTPGVPADVLRHVARVRRKLIVQGWARAGAVAALVLGGVVWAATLLLGLFDVGLPGGPWVWLGAGVLLAAGASLAWALRHAPTDHEAAVAIDARLGLDEKFSTALALGGNPDVFARAAVADAGRTAGRIDLRKKFPLAFPRAAWGIPAWAAAVALTAWVVSPLDLGRTEAEAGVRAPEQPDDAAAEARALIDQQTAALNVLPAEVAEREAFREAREQLDAARREIERDPTRAREQAREAQQNLADALRQQVEQGRQFARAREQARTFRSMTPPADAQGPVAEAHRAMAQADFEQAMQKLEQVVENFDGLTDEQKDRAADQMKDLAEALQQMARDPDAAGQMRQQMQQLGMDEEQAREAQQLMEQAAQGDGTAAEKLRDMADDVLQSMNDGQGPNEQQDQQLRDMMDQLQQQANSREMASQLQDMASQMADAMAQNAGEGQGQGEGAEGGEGGQGEGAESGQGEGQGAGADGGGQDGQGGGNGGMGGGQQMKDLLGQMQAMQQEAQRLREAQGMCQGGGMGGDGGPPGNWGNMDLGGDAGGPQIGAGYRDGKAAAPHGFRAEFSPSHDDESGRIIAQSLVRGEAIRGESNAAVRSIVESETRDATDEVESQRISRHAQQAVRDYFGRLARDAGVGE